MVPNRATHHICPDSSATVKLLGLINDTCKVESTRIWPDTSSTKFNITDFEQNILLGNTWQELLTDSEYKGQLVEMMT